MAPLRGLRPAAQDGLHAPQHAIQIGHAVKVVQPSQAGVGGSPTPSLEGQYIVKNMVLISAVICIGATVRPTPPDRTASD